MVCDPGTGYEFSIIKVSPNSCCIFSQEKKRGWLDGLGSVQVKYQGRITVKLNVSLCVFERVRERGGRNMFWRRTDRSPIFSAWGENTH